MKQKTVLAILPIGLICLMAFRSSKTSEMKEVPLGNYSISLSVKDLSASKVFYEKLGFKQMEGLGGTDQNWMIVSNGNTKIGLFQGLFPTNTITFNPNDGRAVYQILKAEGIKPAFESGINKKEGPCTFSVTDPDGNSILIDQH